MSSDIAARPARRRASRLPYVVALPLLGVLLFAPWVLRDRFEPVVIGSEAPDFVATDMQGEQVRLTDYRGKVVLVNVWATWCAPCRQEMPSMQRLYDSIRKLPVGEDFEILAVSIDADKENPNPLYGGVTREELVAFARELDLTFPIVHDPDGTIQQLYRTTGVPESFVVGRDGIVYRKKAGQDEWDGAANLNLIRNLLEREWPATDAR